jgi:hypothetical protein
MQINGFTLVNEEKINRAIFGTVGREGKLDGGVGERASDDAKIAEYDKLGGLILKGKYTVKTGSFYDFEGRSPRETPEVVLVFRDLAGQVVEIADGEAIPMEVKAAEMIKESKKPKKVKKVKKSIEDDE